MAFEKKASRQQAKLRMALTGPAGSGKTYSALAIASGLGKRTAVIDTEGRARLYADDFEFFDEILRPPFHPDRYIELIRQAENDFDTIVIDSATAEWSGEGGCLDIKADLEAKHRARTGKELGFAAFKEITPIHNRFVQAIVACKAHVICTLRSKQEYVIEGGRPKKVGLAPDARPDSEYEYDVVGCLDEDHKMFVTKSRHAAFTDKHISKPGREFGQAMAEWLNSGAASPAPVVEHEPNYDSRLAEFEIYLASVIDIRTLDSEAKQRLGDAFPKDAPVWRNAAIQAWTKRKSELNGASA